MMLRALCLLLVMLAAWNAVLRPSVDVPITPYYLAFPFVLTVLALGSARMRMWLLAFAAFAVYGLVAGTAYGVPLGMQLSQLVKYLQLLTFLGMLHVLRMHSPSGLASLTATVWALFTMAMAVAIVQALTGFEFPTVVNDESSLWLNTFFFTPNDLALFLGGVLCLALASPLAWPVKLSIVAAIIVLNVRNDAKAALLAAVLALSAHATLLLCRRLHVRPVVGLLLLLALAPLAVLATAESVLDLSDDAVDLVQLLADPLSRIAELDTYDLGGSVFDRADALIHALQAFIGTHGLGLGPAGSVYVLSLPQFELSTAQSLHNALAEFALEFGPAAIVVAAIVVRPVAASLLRRTLSPTEHARALLLIASPFLSVSQSSGFISNYAFWLTAFVVWHIAPATAGAAQRSLTHPRLATRAG